MSLLAHVTSFDLPTLLVAFIGGLAIGLGVSWTFNGSSSDSDR